MNEGFFGKMIAKHGAECILYLLGKIQKLFISSKIYYPSLKLNRKSWEEQPKQR